MELKALGKHSIIVVSPRPHETLLLGWCTLVICLICSLPPMWNSCASLFWQASLQILKPLISNTCNPGRNHDPHSALYLQAEGVGV